MYSKLFKNFVSKNLSTFLLILISISISLFWYIFSDALSKNFLGSIEWDARKNLWWDFSIQLWNKWEETFETFYSTFPYKNSLEIVKDFSLISSIKINEIQPITLHYVDTNYPLYWDFDTTLINPEWNIILSENTYIENNKKPSVTLLWKEYTIKWYYSEPPSSVSTFISDDHAFIDFAEYENSFTNDNNSLIEKQYFFKNTNETLFDSINSEFKKSATSIWYRLQDYKSWWERFSEIIGTLRSYINYAILFSFFLTVTIIFLSCSSFFIKERREISILRLLWMSNKQFIVFYIILFSSILLFSLFISISFSYILFGVMQNYEVTSWFSIQFESIKQWVFIWILILIFSTLLPIVKFLSNEATWWLREDFFTHFTKKEAFIWITFFWIMIVSLSQALWYSIYTSLFTTLALFLFIIIFYFLNTLLLKSSYSQAKKLRQKKFIIFDAMRSSIAPWNMSVLLNMSFFIIFSIWLFILLLFWNFYNRLAVNLETDNNFFALNIDWDTYKSLSPEFKENAFSLIKWRIQTINKKSISEHLWESWNNNASWRWWWARRFSREFNITDNSLSNVKILDWDALIPGSVSVDKNFSKDLNLSIWDTIVFQIYGLEKELTVVNIRESQDFSINPFFYFQVDPQEFEKFPKLYFISDYIEKEKLTETKNYFYEKSNWTASFVEVDKVLKELQVLSTKVLLVIQSLFLYIAIFCILSIIVVWMFFRQFQKQNASLYHLIWFTHKQNKIKSFFEYWFLATIMLIFSILLISFLAYYILSKNSFLSFDMLVYIQSIALILWVYLLIMLGTWFSIRVEK